MREKCEEFASAEGGFEETPFKDMDECVVHIEQSSKKASFVMTAITFLIQSHFACVVFTHWKKAHLPRSKGGCSTEVG